MDLIAQETSDSEVSDTAITSQLPVDAVPVAEAPRSSTTETTLAEKTNGVSTEPATNKRDNSGSSCSSNVLEVNKSQQDKNYNMTTDLDNTIVTTSNEMIMDIPVSDAPSAPVLPPTRPSIVCKDETPNAFDPSHNNNNNNIIFTKNENHHSIVPVKVEETAYTNKNGDTVHDALPQQQQQQQQQQHTTNPATTADATPIHNNNEDNTNTNDDNNTTTTNSTMAAAFTSDTATMSQKLHRIGSSYIHMSASQLQPSQLQYSSGGIMPTIYGRPVHVNDSNGSFPNVASVLGPYFCLGQLGKGTFSSIHKCIDMRYYYHHRHQHDTSTTTTGTSTKSTSSSTSELPQQEEEQQQHRHPVVAAKVELGSFQQSGVLEAEATMLDYLYRHVQPLGTVPKYEGHYRSDKFAAILMEFLPGEDMYQIRERVMSINNTALLASASKMSSLSSTTTTIDPSTIATRRISIDDAVYLTAEVMIPLLRSIHTVGVVHRDVKPSNCVRKNEKDDCKDFCMVDFGLSKSIIVAEDSDNADTEHPWIEGNAWMKPLNYSGTKAYYRKERTKADFRGTSMYASLRVHQGRDYCARDDMWSLMYVFCDLVSGGLPWMSMAANRDRTACQKTKEWIHGEEPGGDNVDNNSPKEHHIDELLKGDLYHIAKYRRDRQKESKVDAEKLSVVPEPLNLSLQHDKISVLQDVFQHLAGLQFWDMPDYDKIQSAIRYFTENVTLLDPEIPPIDWSVMGNTKPTVHRAKHWWSSSSNVPEWILLEDEKNPMDENIFDDIELQNPNRNGHNDNRKRLPIELQFHLAQMDYNLITAREGSVRIHRALHDWMRVALPLLHHEWNSRVYEDGGHRTMTDGFKRPFYLELLRQCVTYASAFDNFQSRDCFYESTRSDPSEVVTTEHGEPRAMKRRKVVVRYGTTLLPHSDMILVSKTLFGLERAIRVETSKKAPPPVRISFG